MITCREADLGRQTRSQDLETSTAKIGLRRLKGILPTLRGTVDLAGQSGRHFKDIQLKSGNWDDFDSCLVFVDEKLEGVGAGYFSAKGPRPILDGRKVQSPKIKFLSTS